MYKHCLLPILPLLPLLSCALPLPAEWHGNSSRLHALLLAISIGTVLLRCLRTKAGMQGILEGVRWYPSVGLLLRSCAQRRCHAETGQFKVDSIGHVGMNAAPNASYIGIVIKYSEEI